MKMIEQLIKRYNLGDITGDILPVSGGLMHKMFKVQTSTGIYAVKCLNPEIMKRPGVMENYKKAEALERILEGYVAAYGLFWFKTCQRRGKR